MQNEDKKRLKISDVLFLLAALLLAASPTLLSSSLPVMEQILRSTLREEGDSPLISSLCQDRPEEEVSGGKSCE